MIPPTIRKIARAPHRPAARPPSRRWRAPALGIKGAKKDGARLCRARLCAHDNTNAQLAGQETRKKGSAHRLPANHNGSNLKQQANSPDARPFSTQRPEPEIGSITRSAAEDVEQAPPIAMVARPAVTEPDIYRPYQATHIGGWSRAMWSRLRSGRQAANQLGLGLTWALGREKGEARIGSLKPGAFHRQRHQRPCPQADRADAAAIARLADHARKACASASCDSSFARLSPCRANLRISSTDFTMLSMARAVACAQAMSPRERSMI
jgi:hypothetical protein